MNSLLSRTNLMGKIFKSKSFTQQIKRNLKNESLYDKVKNNWERATKRIFQIDEPTKGNNVTIFFTGDQMFKSMWDCIENAKESISLETYTIEPDEIGNKTIDLLTKAQQRGVKVRFVYDAIGSSSLSDFDIYQMRVNHVEVYQFNPIYLSLTRLPYTFRNHRKIMVVDEKYGFCGGMNISGKYASSNMEGGKDYFRDTHCMIEGPGAKELLNIFHDSLKDKKLLFKKPNSLYLGSPAKFAQAFPYYDKSQINSFTNNFIDSMKYEDFGRIKEQEQEEEEDEDISTYNDISQTTHNQTSIPTLLIQQLNKLKIEKEKQEQQKQLEIEKTTTITTTTTTTKIPVNNKNINNSTPIVTNNIDNNKEVPYNMNSQGEQDKEDLTEFTIEEDEDYEEEDEFKEFVTFTNDYHNLKSINQLNSYLIDDSNLKPKEEILKEIKRNEREQKRREEEDEEEGEVDEEDYKNKSKTVSNCIVQVQESNQFRGKRAIQKALLIALKGSRDHCYFTTPYFLPPRKLRKAIIAAAQRGVDIKIITAGKSDVPWFRNASRHIYSTFLKNDNVKIYEMMSSTLHAKTLSIDGIYCTIGSYNLDTWSQKNLEANLAFFSPQVANILDEQFKTDIKQCKEVTLQEISNRSLFDKIICYLSFQMSKILKPLK